MFKSINESIRKLEAQVECLDAINYWREEFADIDIQYDYYNERKGCVFLEIKIPSLEVYDSLPAYVVGSFIRTIRDVRRLTKCTKCDGEQKSKNKTKK